MGELGAFQGKEVAHAKGESKPGMLCDRRQHNGGG